MARRLPCCHIPWSFLVRTILSVVKQPGSPDAPHLVFLVPFYPVDWAPIASSTAQSRVDGVRQKTHQALRKQVENAFCTSNCILRLGNAIENRNLLRVPNLRAKRETTLRCTARLASFLGVRAGIDGSHNRKRLSFFRENGSIFLLDPRAGITNILLPRRLHRPSNP